METFQRHVTTAAFKIAGGVDLSSNTSATKPTKQNAIAPAFISKITKAFLDALYAFLDGLVRLAEKGTPVVHPAHGLAVNESATVTGTNPLELLDLTDGVRAFYQSLIELFMIESCFYIRTHVYYWLSPTLDI